MFLESHPFVGNAYNVLARDRLKDKFTVISILIKYFRGIMSR
ncbi:hypothetical protein VCRA2113O324_70034 [Vibrio crassostreae]|nr:hypothetical protein VCRA2113O322_10581 [Vibrio crassostreae]CAK1907284.1 hypothetical protein VCRA2113O326_10581 [Vibrio crassostreae]CAK1940709.1 hypothetical protein VCRA2111O320_230035 [Vibrio crassostreae]CAK2210834.1 hypothetical protein VCRA2113O324_70034 [Vibrio crassostreae]CAK2657824.1 hypothetical protein VCRA2113O323_10329 [Vibrio crassostreae]